MLDHLDIGEQIHYFAQPALVQLRPCEVFRKDILEPLVFLFDAAHGVINNRADLRRMGRNGNDAPAGVGRNKKDALGGVFVNIFLEAVAFRDKSLVFFIETVRNVFKENQP